MPIFLAVTYVRELRDESDEGGRHPEVKAQDLLGPFDTDAEADQAAYELESKAANASDYGMGHQYRFAFIDLDPATGTLKPRQVEQTGRYNEPGYFLNTTDGRAILRPPNETWHNVNRDGHTIDGLKTTDLRPGDRLHDRHEGDFTLDGPPVRKVAYWAVNSPAVNDPLVALYLTPEAAAKADARQKRHGTDPHYAPALIERHPDVDAKYSEVRICHNSSTLTLYRHGFPGLGFKYNEDYTVRPLRPEPKVKYNLLRRPRLGQSAPGADEARRLLKDQDDVTVLRAAPTDDAFLVETTHETAGWLGRQLPGWTVTRQPGQ
jgi:hypothetical protein